ncbi:MAG: hypothetical protein GDA39_03690 [Hyphomonadaceae bacterium]|nr:hypothetical protein [Hyphomonadaceae bacterium]MBC6412047.1 hypothetical protein [Hyphomonadaceae bacterium]
MNQLYHISTAVLDDLRNNIDNHVERYRTVGGFEDLCKDDSRWNIKLDVDVDMERLRAITHDRKKTASGSDHENSIAVGEALEGLTPSLACREEIWARLTHVECNDYAWSRWLGNTGEADFSRSVRKHFFAPGRTGIRDDNAISRLWWNYHIARSVMPQDPERALKSLLKTVDIRQDIIKDRPWISMRKELCAGIIRKMEKTPELAKKKSFRRFMKNVNLRGGGIVFEVMTDQKIDDFLSSCADSTASP